MNTRKRIVGAGVAALISIAALTGCGGGDTADEDITLDQAISMVQRAARDNVTSEMRDAADLLGVSVDDMLDDFMPILDAEVERAYNRAGGSGEEFADAVNEILEDIRG